MKNHWLKRTHTIFTQNKFTLFVASLFVIIAVVYTYGLLWLPPEYDEVLVSNAALNCPSNVFVEQVVWIKGQCFPIMLSSYIGGFMAVPYKLFFLLITPSVVSFRVLNLLLLFVSISFVYFAVKKYINSAVALLSVLLLSFDFQFFYNIRLERTMVVPFLLKSLFLFLTANYFESKQPRFLVLMGIVMGLSIWTKFDAVFFFVALFVGYVLSNYRQIPKLKINLPTVVLFFSGFSIGIAPLLNYLRFSFWRFLYIGRELAGTSFLSTLFIKVKSHFFQFYSYDAVHYVFRDGFKYFWIEIIFSILLFISLIAASIYALKYKKLRPMVIALVVFYVFYLLYGGLKFSHHRTLIYPFPQLILAFYVVQTKKWWLKLIPGLFVLVYISSLSRFYSKIQTNVPDVSFATEVYQLSDYLEKEKHQILIGDWGIANQLLLLSSGKISLKEVAFAANTKSISKFSDTLMRDVDSCEYVVLRHKDNAIFKQADENLRAAIDGKLVYTDQVFEVYKCKTN